MSEYNTDVLIWSEHQSDLLRRLAARVYRQAKRAIPRTMDLRVPLPIPDECPLTLDELLSDA